MFSSPLIRINRLRALTFSSWKSRSNTIPNSWPSPKPPPSNNPNFLLAASIIVVTVAGIGIHRATYSPVPLSNRSRFLLTSTQYENSLGDIEHAKLMQSIPPEKILPASHPASITVTKVAQRILTNIPPNLGLPTQPSYWTISVIKDPTPNAFVLPPLHIVVYTGLFKYATTEDELAGVIAHEIGHVLARHMGEKVSNNVGSTLLAIALEYFTGFGGGLIDLGRKIGIELPMSRKMEREADFIGLHLMCASCFDTSKASLVFERMEADQDTNGINIEWLSTHPGYNERVSKIKELIPVVESKIKEVRSHDEKYCDEVKRKWSRVGGERLRRMREERMRR